MPTPEPASVVELASAVLADLAPPRLLRARWPGGAIRTRARPGRTPPRQPAAVGRHVPEGQRPAGRRGGAGGPRGGPRPGSGPSGADDMEKVGQAARAAADAPRGSRSSSPTTCRVATPAGSFPPLPAPRAAYETWIDQLATAIGKSRHRDRGAGRAAEHRPRLPGPGAARPALPAAALRDEDARRAAQARVYLDAGNPGMFSDPGRCCRPAAERAGSRGTGGASRPTCRTSSGPAAW